MAINLVTKASPKVVERFKRGSCTEGIFSNDYDWKGVATVEVRSIDVLPLNDYDRTLTTGDRFGAATEVGDTVQTMTVQDDKSFNGLIDKGNNTSQLMIKSAAKILRRQTDEVVIPYVDKYRLNKLAAGAGLSATNVTLSKANALETIMTGNAAMSNELVPDGNRVLYIGYTEYIKVKLADQVVHLDKLGESAIVNGVVGKIDKCQVRPVPDSWMPTGVVFMIVHKGCACAPKKLESYRIHENPPGIDGHKVEGRVLHDCFVLETKAKGIYAAKSST